MTALDGAGSEPSRRRHFSRKGIAFGLDLTNLFGLVIPVAQIPFVAALAVALRVNVPMVVASTLVTNPANFGPVCYGAYRLEMAVLGEKTPTDREIEAELWFAQADIPATEGLRSMKSAH